MDNSTKHADNRTAREKRFLIRAAYYAVIAGAVYLALRHAGLILPFVIAGGIAALFQPLIRKIRKRLKIGQKPVSVAVMALFHAAIGLLVYWVVMAFAAAAGEVFTRFPDLLEELSERLEVLPQWLQNAVAAAAESLIASAAAFLNLIPDFVFTLVFTVLLSFFVSFSYEKTAGYILAKLPPKGAELAAKLRRLSANTLARYFRAMLIIMAVTFAELAAGFYLMKLDNPLGTAALLAFFDFLPVLGAGSILAVWAAIKALGGDYDSALWLAGIGAVVAIVRNIIEPKIIGDRLGVNPLVVLGSVFVGYKLFGIVGVLVFPLAVRVVIAVRQEK